MIEVNLHRIFLASLGEPAAHEFATRLKYAIKVRESIPEGPEKALYHLFELHCLRYAENLGTRDPSDHCCHYFTALSNWLFEHFPVGTSMPDGQPKARTLIRLLARRRWTEAARIAPVELRWILDQAPVFGTQKHMHAWHEALDPIIPTIEDIELRDALYGRAESLAFLSWIERVCLWGTFGGQPNPSHIVAIPFEESINLHADLVHTLLTSSFDIFFAKLEASLGKDRSGLWLPVHMQLVANPATFPFDEVIQLRYAEHIATVDGLPLRTRLLGLDYVLVCKGKGRMAASTIIAHLARQFKTPEEASLIAERSKMLSI
jgi:hypothetical protein